MRSMKCAVVLVFLLSDAVLHGFSTSVESGSRGSSISHELSQRDLVLPLRLWIVTTGAYNNHRVVREVTGNWRPRRHAMRDKHNPPSGYFVHRSWPGLKYDSGWRKSSGYAVRYKCPIKNFWLPEGVKQRQMGCDDIFEDKK